jgi:hypothetical protein
VAGEECETGKPDRPGPGPGQGEADAGLILFCGLTLDAIWQGLM